MLTYLKYEYGSFLGADQMEVEIRIRNGKLTRRIIRAEGDSLIPDEQPVVETRDFGDYMRILESFNIKDWDDEYSEPILDGCWWELEYRCSDGERRKNSGNIIAPPFFDVFTACLTSPDLGMKKPGR